MNDNFNTRMILTTAVFAAVAALLAGPAAASVTDGDGVSGRDTSVTAQPDPLAEKGPIPYFSHGIGVDESLSSSEQSPFGPGTIPYLSHGIGVDESLFSGEQSLGLTGDSARTRGQVFQANTTLASNGDSDVNWTWVGFGAGLAALLAAAMGALYLSARHRDRVALP